MPFIPATNTAKVTVQGTLWDEIVQNVIWIKNNIPWTDILLDALNDAIDLWWQGVIANLAADYNFDRVTSADQTTADGLERVKNVSHAGTGGADAEPGNVAMVVTLLTGHRGRSFRGRTYLPGIPLDQLPGSDRNEITTTWVDAVLADYGALDDDISGVSGVPIQVVASHFSGGSPRSSAVLTPVLDYAMDIFIDSQRRRLHGRGT